ncbi:MAG: methylenetetrahydrofolate reductase [bacterium]|nr:methylenetetrahydrofolate reductase [bacterium]
MTRISLELVPRDADSLQADLKYVKENFKDITAINIPDLLRFNVRGWEGCKIATQYYSDTIAHIRAIDFDIVEDFPLTDYLLENGIKEILIIEGDMPQDMGHITYPTKSVQLIRKIRKATDDITIYAAIDPYRSGIREEFDYIREKIDSGANGFLTQPFFDMRLLEIYAEQLKGTTVFWGLSPVVSERTRNYWESRNRAYFPAYFEPTLEWNLDFTKQVIQFCKDEDFDLYLMPIRYNLEKYLNGIFNS